MREAVPGLLEPENARARVDSNLRAPCDLTRLMFVATANRPDPLLRPLLSRLRRIFVAPPQRCHASAIAAGVTRQISTRELRASTGRRLRDWAEEYACGQAALK